MVNITYKESSVQLLCYMITRDYVKCVTFSDELMTHVG